MSDQPRRRNPRSGRRLSWAYPEILSYIYPERNLDFIRELEQQRTQKQEDDISWLNDIFSIR